VPEVTEEILGRITDPERLRALRELDVHSWIGAPLLARGATLGVLHLVMSGSNRRYGAAEVEIATELAQRAGTAVDNARLYRDAQRAVRAREDVLAIVSHDLRNPLAAIDLGATMLLQKPGTDRTTRTQLERILRGGQRMKALIDDLLDMASINAGRFELQRTRLDAGELMSEVVEAHEAVATERGIRLVCACDVQGVPLLADRNRLLQVLGNLIGNALKFCDAGDEVTVRGLREGERFRFVVADTGPGIPDAELPHIFEPYWSGRATKREGTGLGLFITKAIVEAHDGTIDARSEAGRGSTFTVTLPVAAP
jgi:signal transduction histidine kinase